MILTIIAAVDEKGGIGFENQMPWHLPADLARFKKLTMGHHLILGRKTFQSIGKPLPGREMIVLSRDQEIQISGCRVVTSIQKALQVARDAGENEAFVIGGAEIYQLALPLADRLYLSYVGTVSETDVRFPELPLESWEVICEQQIPADEANIYPHTFKHLLRKKNA